MAADDLGDGPGGEFMGLLPAAAADEVAGMGVPAGVVEALGLLSEVPLAKGDAIAVAVAAVADGTDETALLAAGRSSLEQAAMVTSRARSQSAGTQARCRSSRDKTSGTPIEDPHLHG